MPEQRTQHRIRGGKILPFEQTGEFFLRRGMFKQDHNNLVDAIAYYRLALRREPENAEYKLALAEVLTQMNRFEESNRVLLTSFSGTGERPSEGFFGMGCNFIGLQEYANARYSFERYAVIDPEGEFVDEALDMLDALEDEDGLADSGAAVEVDEVAEVHHGSSSTDRAPHDETELAFRRFGGEARGEFGGSALDDLLM
ncbi:hypothetical protein SDC9_184252 [bioreactor metagenome]|uniref:Tetratricopeptide repeat protein n=1 Tax=bioreactor metagenome TaxID=1076179 RepID=A0A645HCI8_9ZZZZ